jgi:hypothetical protein
MDVPPTVRVPLAMRFAVEAVLVFPALLVMLSLL